MEIFIISFLIFVFLIAKKQNKKENTYSSDYVNFRLELEKEYLKNKQIIEDIRLDGEIEREVLRRVQKHYELQEFKKLTKGMDGYQMQTHPLSPCIEIFNPISFSKTIYDFDTAKYANIDIFKLIDEKVNERILKSES